MAVARKHLKNDPDRRMDLMVASTDLSFGERDFQLLDRRNLDHWIAELRKGEAAVRTLRHRLEVLRDGDTRTCPQCGRALRGRADAKYCTDRCRVNAHREAKRAEAGGTLPPETMESLITTTEAANLSGVSPSTIRKWAQRGHLTAAGQENGRPLYRWIDVAKAERKTRDAARGRSFDG